MTGAYIARELGFHNMKLPTYAWHVHTKTDKFGWYHPRDLIFYNYMNGGLLGAFFLPLLLLMAVHSYLKPKEVTSGKCLWFYRFQALRLFKGVWGRLIGSLGVSLGERLMKRQHGSQPFRDVFNFYFKNQNHPVNQEIKKYYEGK
jgi:hypothetical protein